MKVIARPSFLFMRLHAKMAPALLIFAMKMRGQL